jgi:hypothetical protein
MLDMYYCIIVCNHWKVPIIFIYCHFPSYGLGVYHHWKRSPKSRPNHRGNESNPSCPGASGAAPGIIVDDRIETRIQYVYIYVYIYICIYIYVCIYILYNVYVCIITYAHLNPYLSVASIYNLHISIYLYLCL